METIIAVILYALDASKYWIGNRLFFEGRMHRPWLAVAGGVGLFVWINIFNITGAGAHVLAASVAVVVAGIMMETTVKRKVLNSIWLFGVVTSLDSILAILYSKIVESEKIVNILAVFSTLIVIYIGGYAADKIFKKITNRKKYLLFYMLF
ncbi:MAG: hypothetical protein IJP31_03180 [Lachnospiraceae bacterium]|nr:hypothetical protein [Lachnospiraceae bacterium]